MVIKRPMGFLAKWRIHREGRAGKRVEVSEKDGVRTLHLGNDMVQSAMRIQDPFHLELAYTQAMLACLLFHRAPRRFLMIGLGGGSVPKWVWKHLPQADTTVVEIDPQVVACARQFFHVPPDDERFRVVVADGAEYVRESAGRWDILMVDGYDEHCQVEALTTTGFYQECRAALADDGILVINLWSSDGAFNTLVERLFEVFDGLVLLLPAGSHSNVIALCFARSPHHPKWDDLRQRALELGARHGMDFRVWVDGLRRLNLHNLRRLLI